MTSAYLNSNLDDIQGLILRGYNFQYIRYIILKIQHPVGAQQFCAALLPENHSALSITTATPWPGGIKPEYCLNLGISYSGLVQLITKPNCALVANRSAQLFNTYKLGATNRGNSVSIGDTDESAPANWWARSGGWLLPESPTPTGEELHLQLTLYVKTPEDREKYYDLLLGMIPLTDGQPAVIPAFFKDSDPVIVDDDPDYIHFGYKDSLSQPRVGEVPWNKTANRLKNGMSTIDDRPIVPAYHFVISQDKKAPYTNVHPLLLNGSFAAFRLLYQDVEAFNAFINKGSNPELVAAKMCGRWFDGTPLMISPDGEDKTLKDFDYTNFNYKIPTANQKGPRANDDSGELCPYAAHIRRANPRDDSAVKGNEPILGISQDSVQHRVMRRASPYGVVYQPGEKPGIQRGLVGLFIGADLDSQFQFIMSQWISRGSFRSPDFSNNQSGIDPLFGRHPNDKNPANKYFEYYVGETGNTPPYEDLPGLTRFIRTDGSLYVFLPGITALKYISEGKIPVA